MKERCCECCTGEPPPKQPDMPIAEIEEDMRRLRSPAQMDEFAAWLKERPVRVQQAVRDFPHFQMYLVKEGAPYKYTCGGSVVSPLSYIEDEKTGRVDVQFRVLRSPIGQAGVAAVIGLRYLEPITLDDLKVIEKLERLEER